MPNELSIQGVSPLNTTGDTTTEPKGEAFAPPAAATPVSSPLYVNPSLRLDPTLGLVVIEFRDPSGSVTSSIPSQRQLQAYRLHQQPMPNAEGGQAAVPAPGGGTPAPDAAKAAPAQPERTTTAATVPTSRAAATETPVVATRKA
ncbi:MAG: hypothetical protein P4L71_22070 [Acetobacteraceae bacterium]|nr:hypothetical protein [Acetobacteraceae bacterium]